MAHVVISVERPVEQLTDRELIQTFIYAVDLHDHLGGGAPYPSAVMCVWDTLAERGYATRWLAAGGSMYGYLKGLL